MTDKGAPKAGNLAFDEMVPVGFERVYTGDQNITTVDTDLAFSKDKEGYVMMQYSLWGFCFTTEDQWNEEIHVINSMQAELGPLDDNVRKIRAHIASFVACDNGVPVTIDEILNAIGTGELPETAFHPGCWLSSGTRTTQPNQVKSMRVIEAVLQGYLAGKTVAELIDNYSYAEGFIKRTFEWLGPRVQFSDIQELMMERVLLAFVWFAKHSTNQQEIYMDWLKPGGRGKSIDAKIASLADTPEIYADYTKEYRINLESIEDEQKKKIYMIAGHIANGVSELSDCHHNTFRFIERWIHAIGTFIWDIPTRRPHTESTRLGRLLFGYALGLDRWLQHIPQQFVLLDLGHTDLGFDPKNEILRVYAYLGDDHSPEKVWLAACLWFTLVSMPPASLYKWGHRHKDLLARAAENNISVRNWMNTILSQKS